jgi:hypothetical protein
MHNSFQDLVYIFNDKFIAYLPDFIAGIAFMLFGLAVGWLGKRFFFQLAMVLRVDRYFAGFRWGREFVKADLRYGLYNLIGNIGFLIIFMLFIYRVTTFWKLSILARLLEQGILFLPRLITALIVFSLGWLIASWTAKALQKAMMNEEIPRATLIARFVRAVVLLFFSAMALTVLDVAREVVLIGFSTVFITLGALIVVFAVVGGKFFINELLKSRDEEES